jgi:hypothetical protein
MPQDSPRALAHYHRVRWLFTQLYLGGLRIAEVGGNTMGPVAKLELTPDDFARP